MRTQILLILGLLLITTFASAEVTIVVDPVRDMIPGESIFYPVLIQNSNNQDIDVSVGLTGVQDWATYRVDPYQVITVKAESQEQVFIFLRADRDAAPGTKDFQVSASYDGQTEYAPLRLAVLKEVNEPTQAAPWVWIALAIIIIILLLVAFTSKKHDGEEEEDEETTIEY